MAIRVTCRLFESSWIFVKYTSRGIPHLYRMKSVRSRHRQHVLTAYERSSGLVITSYTVHIVTANAFRILKHRYWAHTIVAIITYVIRIRRNTVRDRGIQVGRLSVCTVGRRERPSWYNICFSRSMIADLRFRALQNVFLFMYTSGSQLVWNHIPQAVT
jgi:hypothetical protein